MSSTAQHTTTIVAAATPRGRGGIAIIRLSGPRALPIAKRIFRGTQPLGRQPRKIQYGEFLDAQQAVIDTGLAWYMQGPGSYTGEDTVEMSTHGSELVVQLLVNAALAAGAIVAEAGEFTQRAFLNGRLDLLQAEAVLDLIQAGTRQDLSKALGATSGRLSADIGRLRDGILDAVVQVEAEIDFTDEDIDPTSLGKVQNQLGDVLIRLRQLRQGYAGIKRRRDGWMVLLAGPANVGKSTLLNALAQEDRAIVSATPGTTRDWLDARVVWDGELLRLVDSAGLRNSEDVVEKAGVERTRKLAHEADVILFVLDGSQPWPGELEDSDVLRASHLLVLNKRDLAIRSQVPADVESAKVVLSVSAKAGDGLQALQESVMASLPRHLGEREGIFRERHEELLRGCEEAIVEALDTLVAEPEKAAADLREALVKASSLLGEDVEEIVLDRIFQEFCIGK